MTFGSDIFKNVRVVNDGILQWHVAKDICNALDIRNSCDMVSRLDDDEHKVLPVDTDGGKQMMNVVSESGIYHLLLFSHKEYARNYQRWLTHDVLPILHHNGRYEKETEKLGKRIDSLKETLEASGIIKPFVNPRYTFDNLKSRYLAAVPNSHARDFYEALGNWYGIPVS